MITGYQLRCPISLAHDGADEYLDIDALAASGDCFVTLASLLDAAQDDASQRAVTERVVRALLQLQRTYRIVRKTPDYRQ